MMLISLLAFRVVKDSTKQVAGWIQQACKPHRLHFTEAGNQDCSSYNVSNNVHKNLDCECCIGLVYWDMGVNFNIQCSTSNYREKAIKTWMWSNVWVTGLYSADETEQQWH